MIFPICIGLMRWYDIGASYMVSTGGEKDQLAMVLSHLATLMIQFGLFSKTSHAQQRCG